MNTYRKISLATALLATIWPALSRADGHCEWVSLFNGKDLEGWTAKVAGYPAGENPGNIFRVEDGTLTVSYDAFTSFDGLFGHLYSDAPYSRYRLRLEYRFLGEQVEGGPEWAWRNSGVMLHTLPAHSIPLGQDFPVSIEAQFLGGRGDGTLRHTGNLCTPGTHVHMNGVLDTRHCIDSTSPTFDGDQWVSAELVVLGGDEVIHYIGGEEVMRYTRPVHGEDDAVGAPLTSGHFALQAESAPVQFRNIELLDLSACPEIPPGD